MCLYLCLDDLGLQFYENETHNNSQIDYGHLLNEVIL